MPTQYATPKKVLDLEKKNRPNMLSKKELDQINSYVEKAWMKAGQEAKSKSNRDAIYHRLMNEHAHKLGLRII